MTYGKYVFSTLKSERHFYDFVGDEKAQEHDRFPFVKSKLCDVQRTYQTNFQQGPHR